MELKENMPDTWYDKVCMPTSINQIFYSKCKQKYGEQNCKEQKAKQEEQQSKKKEHAIAIEIEVFEGAEGINRVQFPNKPSKQMQRNV